MLTFYFAVVFTNVATTATCFSLLPGTVSDSRSVNIINETSVDAPGDPLYLYT